DGPVSAASGQFADRGAHVLWHHVTGRFAVFQHKCGAIHQAEDALGAAVGDLAGDHTTQAVPGNHNTTVVVGVESGQDSGHVVVVAGAGPVPADVAPAGQGRGDHAMSRRMEAITHAVPAPRSLPGAVDKHEG